MQLQSEYEHKADLYYAYASVHSYVTDPFTSLQPEMLFQVARFIINSLGNAETIPFGVSKASTMYTLARQAMVLGAYKLARHAYDRLVGELSRAGILAKVLHNMEIRKRERVIKHVHSNGDVLKSVILSRFYRLMTCNMALVSMAFITCPTLGEFIP